MKANSKFKILEMDWSIDEFLRQIDTIIEIDNRIRSIESKMSMQRIAEALLRDPAPKGGFGVSSD